MDVSPDASGYVVSCSTCHHIEVLGAQAGPVFLVHRDTPAIAEAITDSRNRTIGEIRKIFSKCNGNMGEPNSVAWMFDTKGLIVLAKEAATLDLLSDGRAEIMAGRGSFTESFPLFGYDLHDYDSLFAEKLELLLEIRKSERVTWSGRHRPPIEDRGVYPRPLQDPLPVWVAIGGTPKSAVRAGTLGLPLALAIIGGEAARFAPFAELHRRASADAGHGRLPFSINAHGYLADDSQQASDDAWPAAQLLMNRIARERGFTVASASVW